MNGKEAMVRLMQGKAVRCKDWCAEWYWKIENGIVMTYWKENNYEPAILTRPNLVDILNKQWEVYHGKNN